jgi:hypothetical protein
VWRKIAETLRRTIVASLSAGMVLGIAAGARSGRAEVDASTDPRAPRPLPYPWAPAPSDPFDGWKPGEGRGGGGNGESCIGIAATCKAEASRGSGYVPRGCERRMPAPDAWTNAEVTLDRLEVRPLAAVRAVHDSLVGTDGGSARFARECYREALAARRTTAGRVTIRLRFSGGCTTRFHVVANTTGDRILADCAAESLLGIRFDEAADSVDGMPFPSVGASGSARLTLLFRRAPKKR